ncbi:MAG: very short patch repair endonuclease [Phycisphaerae bacterium]|nr:very short patch repair endonuclease [Phycisphaerae bacterium]
MDNLTTKQRSRQMSLVRAKDTKPEMTVRRLVHALGYRYRLHVKDLPGCPDLVFPARRAVIFVHGCFWHQHRCPQGNRMPKSRRQFWKAKLSRNKARDSNRAQVLRRVGWRVLTVWECQLRPSMIPRFTCRLLRFLESE